MQPAVLKPTHQLLLAVPAPTGSGTVVQVAAPATPLTITRRWVDDGRLFVVWGTAPREWPATSQTMLNGFAIYSVERIFAMDAAQYLVLAHLPGFASPDQAPYTLIRLETAESGTTLSEQELQWLTPYFATDVGRDPQWPLSDILNYWSSWSAYIMGQPTSWVGRQVGDYLMENLVGQGGFSSAYRAIHQSGDHRCVFKVAKPADGILPWPQHAGWQKPFVPSAGGTMPTLGYLEPPGSGGHTALAPRDVLRRQTARLQGAGDPALVRVEELVDQPDEPYARLEWIEGPTLRERMEQGPVPLSVFIELARILDRLAKNASFGAHGDLKPENIMLSGAGVRLIDPGELDRPDKSQPPVRAVTTPAYYPLVFNPNDLFALGVILWEVACKRHPFAGVEVAPHGAPEEIPPLSPDIEDDLHQVTSNAIQSGNRFFAPLAHLRRPCVMNPDLPAAAEPVLLRAMRLQLSPAGKLTVGPKYDNFLALAGALEGLQAQGITAL